MGGIFKQCIWEQWRYSEDKEIGCAECGYVLKTGDTPQHGHFLKGAWRETMGFLGFSHSSDHPTYDRDVLQMQTISDHCADLDASWGQNLSRTYLRTIHHECIYININSQSIAWLYKVIYDIILTNSPSQPWPWQADLVERVNQVVEVCDGENWVVLRLRTLSSMRFWRIY